jgi:FixJ family two-component response regulator
MAAARPVIVIDDDPAILGSVRTALQREGFAVRGILESREAVDAVVTGRPCAVLLDLQMPGKDGLTLLNEIRARVQVPVIMLTGMDRSESAVRAMREGAFDYLTKPVHPRRLAECVRLAVATGAAPPDVHGVGRYRIVKELGRGGMGIVYEAVDPALERRVALKVLRPEYAADTRYEALFLSEARAAAKVSHPALVTIYETGRHRGGLYLAMEFVHGETLHRMLQSRQPFTPEEALRVVARLAAGLEAAHEAGLMHGDVKPSNVILTRSRGVKLLDFGVARPMRAGAPSREELAYAMGTPAYLSPEAIRGEPLGAHSDIYALGVVLHEMLAREQAFTDRSTLALLGRIERGRVSRPLLRVRRVSARLRKFVERLMAVDPADRPGSMADVAAEARRLGAR